MLLLDLRRWARLVQYWRNGFYSTVKPLLSVWLYSQAKIVRIAWAHCGVRPTKSFPSFYNLGGVQVSFFLTKNVYILAAAELHGIEQLLANIVLQRKALTLEVLNKLKRGHHDTQNQDEKAALANLYKQLAMVSMAKNLVGIKEF